MRYLIQLAVALILLCLYFAIMSMLVGCTPSYEAPRPNPNPTLIHRYPGVAPSYNDYRVVPLLQKFHKLTGLPIDRIPVVMDENREVLQGERTAGGCTLDIQDRRVIAISPDYWDYGPVNMDFKDIEFFRELLLYHEIGHCLLRREHDPSELGRVPWSIMYPHIKPELVDKFKDERWYTYYIKELTDGRDDTQLLPE